MSGYDVWTRLPFVLRSRFSKCCTGFLTLTLPLLVCVLGTSLVHAQATTSPL